MVSLQDCFRSYGLLESSVTSRPYNESMHLSWHLSAVWCHNAQTGEEGAGHLVSEGVAEVAMTHSHLGQVRPFMSGNQCGSDPWRLVTLMSRYK